MTDVLLSHTDDGGEIEQEDSGDIKLTDLYETAWYLSLFGGNEDDSGDDDTAHLQWWANHEETIPERRYRSAFQSLVRSLPAVTANLRRLEDAASADLAWFVEGGYATSVLNRVTMTGPNRIQLASNLEIDGTVYPFVESNIPWGGA